MVRLASLLTLALVGACSPEVLIARHEATAGASGSGGEPTAGSGGALTGGSGGAAAGEGGEPAAPEPPRILADSVADFTLTQGSYGWYYGSDDGSLEHFTLLTEKSVIILFEPVIPATWDCWANKTAHWTQIFRLGAHPNGTDTSSPSNAVLERAVRRWVSNYAGKVIISGEAAKIDLVGSNGVDVLIYVDGVLLFNQFIQGDDGAGLAYELSSTLNVGSTVDFVLDPHEGADHHDLSRFTAAIVREDARAE
jgi:hypothetical protein